MTILAWYVSNPMRAGSSIRLDRRASISSLADIVFPLQSIENFRMENMSFDIAAPDADILPEVIMLNIECYCMLPDTRRARPRSGDCRNLGPT